MAFPAARNYTLRVVSHRNRRSQGSKWTGSGMKSVPMTSNSVQFRVIAARPSGRLSSSATAMSVLDNQGRRRASRPRARVLRFLGSELPPGNWRARFWAQNDQPHAGTHVRIGRSPHRATAIEGIKVAMAEPSIL